MQRRVLLSQAALLALAGCGFQLRAAPVFAFDSIYITAAETSPLGNELKRTLKSLKTVRVITNPALQSTAQAILDIPLEQREKTVVGVNSTGQVREFQIRLRVRFKLRTPQGEELIPESEILQQRDISFNESAVLAKESEEGLMYRDMQSDIVQQLMRRLAAVKAL
jgi:LPS-assembly lipoprotein